MEPELWLMPPDGGLPANICHFCTAELQVRVTFVHVGAQVARLFIPPLCPRSSTLVRCQTGAVPLRRGPL